MYPPCTAQCWHGTSGAATSCPSESTAAGDRRENSIPSVARHGGSRQQETTGDTDTPTPARFVVSGPPDRATYSTEARRREGWGGCTVRMRLERRWGVSNLCRVSWPSAVWELLPFSAAAKALGTSGVHQRAQSRHSTVQWTKYQLPVVVDTRSAAVPRAGRRTRGVHAGMHDPEGTRLVCALGALVLRYHRMVVRTGYPGHADDMWLQEGTGLDAMAINSAPAGQSRRPPPLAGPPRLCAGPSFPSGCQAPASF